MSKDDNPGRTSDDLAQLRSVIDSQAEQIEGLKAQLVAETDRISRRGLIKGLGLTSLVALGAAGALGGAESALATPGGVSDNSDLAGVLPAYLTLTANGATIVGDVTLPGREGAIEVLYYQQAVSSLKDAGSGMATGKRQYTPIVIRKRIDKSTPLLFKALVQNEVVNAIIKFWRPTSNGGEEQFFTVTITSGRVAGIEDYLPEIFKTGSEASVQPLEQVSLTFSTITWTWTDGGIEYSDSWNQR